MAMDKRFISLGLSLIGVFGVGVTSWLSIRCHEKAKDKETKKEKILAYAPAIVSGVGTSACILGSHHVSRKEIAALTASCTYLAANREKIEQKLKEQFGEEKALEIKKSAAIEARKEVNKKAETIIERTKYGNVHCVELLLGREFYCSQEHLKWAEDMLNQMFKNGERVNWNTYYELLGLDKTREGFELGWPMDDITTDNVFGYSPDKPIYFEYIHGLDENDQPMITIDVRFTPPIRGYLEV